MRWESEARIAGCGSAATAPCLFSILVFALLFLSGCSNVQRVPPVQVWDDMKKQEKFKPQMENDLFADHRDSRRPPEGVVARGHLADDTPYFTGMEGDLYVGKNPAADHPNVDLAALLDKGHAAIRDLLLPAATIVRDRAPASCPLACPPGDLPISYGRPGGAVRRRGDFQRGHQRAPAPCRLVSSFQVAVEDRWAIIAYLRVLRRLPQHASTINDVPAAHRTGCNEIEKSHFRPHPSDSSYQMETARWTTGRNVLTFVALAAVIAVRLRITWQDHHALFPALT